MKREQVIEYLKSAVLDDNIVRQCTPPHTAEVESLPVCHNGVETANYYFVSKYFDYEIDGEGIVTELEKMQIKDESFGPYGCMRWYREETHVADSNGAFFIIMPLALTLRFCEEKLSEAEKTVLLRMLERGAHWFAKECKTPILYYSNKIVSDGAMLMLCSFLLKNEEVKNEARAFWRKWLEYTQNCGWGWGENASACYSVIILNALNLTLCGLEESDELYAPLYEARSVLINYMCYHEGYEFVPTIRSYNFTGETRQSNPFDLIYDKEIVIEQGVYAIGKCSVFTAHILYSFAPKYIPQPDTGSFHKERIYEDSYAFTYKGKNVRLGTISHFPVMRESAQNNGWGLAWQSMPVGALAKAHSFAFLQFRSESEGTVRSHPAYDKHSAYLDNKLFAGENIPLENTYCKQEGNTAIVVRDLRFIANSVSYFADEWLVQNFRGEVIEYKNWTVFHYGDCVVAVCSPLNPTKLKKEGDTVRLAQVCYEGEEKLLIQREWTGVWCIVALDNPDGWQKALDEKEASVKDAFNGKTPRIHYPQWKIRCGEIEMDFDPFQVKVY